MAAKASWHRSYVIVTLCILRQKQTTDLSHFTGSFSGLCVGYAKFIVTVKGPIDNVGPADFVCCILRVVKFIHNSVAVCDA